MAISLIRIFSETGRSVIGPIKEGQNYRIAFLNEGPITEITVSSFPMAQAIIRSHKIAFALNLWGLDAGFTDEEQKIWEEKVQSSVLLDYWNDLSWQEVVMRIVFNRGANNA